MASIVHQLNSTISSKMITNHSYYPLEVEIAHLIANEYSVPMLLSMFAGLCGLILFGTVSIVDRVHPRLPATEKAAIWWLVLSGAIHLFFEGYFSLNHTRMGPAQDLFGQLWKEYALSDSRYLTSDPFVLCMETVTAFTWGPLCFVVALFVATSHPLRHPLQIIVCVGQIYGLILYYATSMFDHFYTGVTYSRPEFLYFWVYYFFMNFIWMVFPGMLLVSSVRTIAKAFQALEKLDSRGANGKAINGKAKNGHTKSS
ncbi:EBP-domain-containing protein [Acephala macrosclerotiorum]|nr:EBP-domain-containing protein [Acephala macrosclerotiorum]